MSKSGNFKCITKSGTTVSGDFVHICQHHSCKYASDTKGDSLASRLRTHQLTPHKCTPPNNSCCDWALCVKRLSELSSSVYDNGPLQKFQEFKRNYPELVHQFLDKSVVSDDSVPAACTPNKIRKLSTSSSNSTPITPTSTSYRSLSTSSSPQPQVSPLFSSTSLSPSSAAIPDELLQKLKLLSNDTIMKICAGAVSLHDTMFERNPLRPVIRSALIQFVEIQKKVDARK